MLALTQWQWKEHSRYIVNVELMGFTDRLSKCQKGKVTPSFWPELLYRVAINFQQSTFGGTMRTSASSHVKFKECNWTENAIAGDISSLTFLF